MTKPIKAKNPIAPITTPIMIGQFVEDELEPPEVPGSSVVVTVLSLKENA